MIPYASLVLLQLQLADEKIFDQDRLIHLNLLLDRRGSWAIVIIDEFRFSFAIDKNPWILGQSRLGEIIEEKWRVSYAYSSGPHRATCKPGMLWETLCRIIEEDKGLQESEVIGKSEDDTVAPSGHDAGRG